MTPSWRNNTTSEIAAEDDSRYETPGGAQQKANTALADAKDYTDTKITSLPEIVGGVGITVTDTDNTKVIIATGVSLPAPHATSHITGGTDIIPNVVAAGNSGLMTGSDKTKLNGIATGANNYTHPNHTGDVTSTGDGATAIAAGVIVDADVNATAGIAATKIGSGAVSNTEFGYLDGVTSALQTQLNAITNPPRAQYTSNVDKVCTTYQWVIPDWNVLVYDTNTFVSVGTPTVITINKAGTYLIKAHITFAANASGQRSIRITKNSDAETLAYNSNAAVSNAMRINVGTIALLSAGDTIRVSAYQDTGGDLALSTATGIKMSIHMLCP
jgi:hypothetical protein